ncbi:MAG: PrpR N-terminal domain-containing protein [Oscillospiraceae bacterium]
MSDTYKICFLGYKKLGELAHQVIEHLNYSDTTIILKECSIETLVQAVNEAISEGCQVFVAGSANAEEFKRRFYEHLIELHIDMSDYLYCLQRAKELGAKKIAVTVHRKSRKVDFDVLQSLTKIPIHTIYYQSETELEYNLSHTDCDCVIGAALANENAERLGLKGILIYEGEYTIRSSIDQARNLAAELQSASRKESITNAIIRNVPAGIIITDENGRITTFNKQAKKLTGFQEQKLRGQFLSDVIPSLSYAAFYKSGQFSPTASTSLTEPWCAASRPGFCRATSRSGCSQPYRRITPAARKWTAPGNFLPITSGKTSSAPPPSSGGW